MDTDDQIDLARVTPFQIGTLKVEPATRQVSITRTLVETLEPRVMQVLVALASANGAVVSRDDLIRRCWGGRIVGEDSISRTIARLRKLSEDHPDAGFRIETITKVGYRLIGAAVSDVADAAAPPPTPRAAATPAPRRWWLMGLAVLGVFALAALVWRVTHPAPQPLRATLRIGSFKPLNGGIPPNLPQTFASEMLQQNSTRTNRAITIVNTPPTDSAQARAEQAFLISGSIRRSGDSLRYDVDLSREGGGDTVLSQSFDAPLGAGDAAIGEIVAKATTNIQCTITYGLQGRTTPLPPETARLLAQWCRANNAPEPNVTVEIATLREMLKVSPDFTFAWAGLAVSLTVGIPDAEKVKGQPVYDEAMAALAIAERLGPPSYIIENARARLLPTRAYAQREAILRSSAERFGAETGGFAAYTYGNFLFNIGRIGDAMTQHALALQMNPGRVVWRVRQIDLLLADGQVEQADRLLAQLVADTRDPDVALDARLSEALRRGQYDAAAAIIAGATRIHPQLKAAMAQALAALRADDAAAKAAAARQLIELSAAKPTRARFTVAALAALGEDAAALQLAAAFATSAGIPPTQLFFQPALAKARTLPQFTALTQQLGLADYWRTSRRPPDMCSAAAPPPVCAGVK